MESFIKRSKYYDNINLVYFGISLALVCFSRSMESFIKYYDNIFLVYFGISLVLPCFYSYYNYYICKCCTFEHYIRIHQSHCNFLVDAVGMTFRTPGTGPIHMDDVNCRGTESALTQCPHRTTHNCDHSEDAGVTCQIRKLYFSYLACLVKYLFIILCI